MLIRKGSRFTDGLAALCMMIVLSAAHIAAAQAEGGEGTAPAAKKKIALTQFDVANTMHVDDINNIYDGLPQVLSSRLEASGEFLPAYTGRSIPVEAGEAQREAIIRIAEEAGAQFLLSGMVVNAGITREKGFWGTTVGRHIEVELAVYDGLTGARLLLRRLGKQVYGDVMVGNDKPFGSSIFFETELGKALNGLIGLAVKDIRAALGNMPLSAHVIRVEEKKVVLDAGSDSLLKSGDQFVVYARDAGARIAGLNGSALGVMDRAADIVTLTQVQQQFSIGELPGDAVKSGIRAGNVARIDPAEQRLLVAKQIAVQQAAKAEQDARDEAARVKAEQAAQAEAARVKAEQDAKAEAARIKAEKKAAAQAKAKAAAEAKAAKLKARQEAIAARVKAAQKARARELAREKARAAAEAKAAKLKAKQEARAEAARIKAEKKAQAEAEAKAAAAAAAQQTAESGVAKTKTGAEAAAQQAAGSGVAQAKTEAEAAVEAERAKKKPGVPLKLKQIKP